MASDRQSADEDIHNGKEPAQNSAVEPSDSEPTTRPTSTAQTEANRLNAQKSTGPRSAEGKRRSAMNAMTYGAYGRAQAIPRGILSESELEVEQYVASIVEALAPRDALELVIARRIATADLRLARLERYEGVAMAKIGRFILGPGEAIPELLELARTYSHAAMKASQCLRDKVPLDVETWQDIVHLIWYIQETPEEEQLPPDIPDDHEPVDVWEQFVLEELISRIWPNDEAACAAFDAEHGRRNRFLLKHDGEAEERVVIEALAKGGPIDSASFLRARVQREGYRDRATYAELKKRVLSDEDEGQDRTGAEAS